MNKKGFTLIELLAVIVILGIVMAIAIPGINALINNSRKNTFEQTAKLYTDNVRVGVSGGLYPVPKNNTAYYVPLNEIDMEKGGDKSPWSVAWNMTRSYVVVVNDDGKNYYWFAASETETDGNYMPLLEESKIKASEINKGNRPPLASSLVISDVGLTGSNAVPDHKQYLD